MPSRRKTITLTIPAADADAIVVDDTRGSSGDLTLDGALVSGGVATLTTPSFITVYSTGVETALTFTISGTDRNGNSITEDITGPNNGTSTGTKNFKTVTGVSTSGAIVSTVGVDVGTANVTTTPWFPVNHYNWNGLALGVEISSTANWTVQHTFDDVFAAGFKEGDATVFNHDTLAAKTVNEDGNYVDPPAAIRLKANSGDGTLTFHIIPGDATG